MGNMFQKKIDKLLSSIPNVFGIADDLLNTGFDEQGKDHSETFEKLLRSCKQANLNKDKFFSGTPAFCSLVK